MAVKGKVHSLESFGAVDGPGIRFIVFLQGCRMRCRYCHNPETWQIGTGDEMTAQEILDKALRYKSYWGKEGGITVSGGESLLQMDFLLELFSLCKAKGINTCIDTAGNPFDSSDAEWMEKFDRLCDMTDLFMLDIKQINDKKHRDLTGFSNDNILEMARYLSDRGNKMWIRHVLVPGITTDEDDLRKTKEFIDTLDTVTRVEVLPYHKMGIPQYERMGIKYTLEGIDPPTQEEVKRAEEILGITH